MTKALFVTALCLSSFIASPVSAADAPAAFIAVDANKILEEIDRRANAFSDQEYSAEMKILKSGELKKTLTFNASMKGLQKQFIHFTGPGDVAGMKILMQDARTLYVYLPEFKKVRRVAAHAMNQGFLGGEFTYQDMTETQLAPFYTAELTDRTGKQTTLTLSPKANVQTPYSKLEVVIDASKGGVTKINYYDGSSRLVRQQLREGWSKVGGELIPTKVSMGQQENW